MPVSLDDRLVVAISSRALFDLSESHAIYERDGVEAYQLHQVEREAIILKPGVAFDLARKLLRLNLSGRPFVEVVLLSRNSADTGLRVFNSIQHYGLAITRAVFTSGSDTSRYVSALGSHLFLSADASDVKHALESGHAAATIVPRTNDSEGSESTVKTDVLRIAFDGDAVLFSDEAERVFQSDGLEAFSQSEKDAARKPLAAGPFQNFLTALHRIQTEFPRDQQPIRTALVTARSAPAHERVIRTLRQWGIRIDEALFLGGLDKAEFLRVFGADIFFDDQRRHVESASRVVPSGHVPHGVVNQVTGDR
jgi:5'-nucleotidase